MLKNLLEYEDELNVDLTSLRCVILLVMVSTGYLLHSGGRSCFDSKSGKHQEVKPQAAARLNSSVFALGPE